MNKAISFDGRVAVVTGAGRGIGNAYARELARRGASVVVNDIEESYAKKTAHEIVAAGGQAVDVCASVSTPMGGSEIIAAAIDYFGQVDIVISNAGIFDCEDFGGLSVDEIIEMHDVHLMGAYWVIQPAWRAMKTNDYGRIVIVGSSTGQFGQHGTAPYGSAKAGLWGLMKALACEAEGSGVRVNMVMPGAATTIRENAYHKITARGLDFGEYMFGERAKGFERLQANLTRSDPMVNAPMVAFLASDQCSLNGEAFTCARGYYARVFTGIAAGWLAPDVAAVSAELIRERLAEIRDCSSFTMPRYTADELLATLARIEELPGHS